MKTHRFPTASPYLSPVRRFGTLSSASQPPLDSIFPPWHAQYRPNIAEATFATFS